MRLRGALIHDGKPRSYSCESYDNYKALKRPFRDEPRKAYNDYFTSVSETI